MIRITHNQALLMTHRQRIIGTLPANPLRSIIEIYNIRCIVITKRPAVNTWIIPTTRLTGLVHLAQQLTVIDIITPDIPATQSRHGIFGNTSGGHHLRICLVASRPLRGTRKARRQRGRHAERTPFHRCQFRLVEVRIGRAVEHGTPSFRLRADVPLLVAVRAGVLGSGLVVDLEAGVRGDH